MRRVHRAFAARTASVLTLSLLAFTLSTGAEAAPSTETPDPTATTEPVVSADPTAPPAEDTEPTLPPTPAVTVPAMPDPSPVPTPEPTATATPDAVVPDPVEPDATVPGATSPAPADPSPPAAEPEAQYVVLYADGTDVDAEVDELRADGTVVEQTFTQAPAAEVTLTAADAAALEATPQVEAVEPDSVVSAFETQPGAPWGLDRTDQRTLPLSRTYTSPGTASGVTVYVLDTGVSSGHADFEGRVQAGWSAIADGRGTQDCNGHGTHIAGTVAGRTFGIAKGATIVPVRILGCDGKGTLSDLLAGIDWITATHPSGAPAVANFSLGGVTSLTLDASLETMIADGITAVVAAGNSSVDACSVSPARFPAAVTVAAMSPADGQSSFTNVGRCVDLYAPGENILSASHTSTTGTVTKSGTSTATPHVTGAAALLLAENRALTPAQVSAALVARATTGVVTGVSTSTPNRLLYVPPTTGGSAPQPAPQNATPIGTIDAVTTTATTITVRGWALDPDTTASIPVHVYVDGKATAAATASGDRPDVDAAYRRGAAHGYGITVPATPGQHTVCVYAINTTPGTNPLLGCRTVTE